MNIDPASYTNNMQRMYANLLRNEYKDVLRIHMTELLVLNYAHHVRGNDTYILRHEKHSNEYHNRISYVSVFYISKTNLYSRPSNPDSYRFANMVAYKMSEYPEVAAGFEQDDDYCIRVMSECTGIALHEICKPKPNP